MDAKTIELTSQLLLVCLPAIFIRINDDNLKYFLRGQGIIQEVGIGINVSVVLFLIYSYVIMVTFNMGVFGYGLCLFVYEVLTISVSIWCFAYLVNPRAFDTSIPIFRKVWFTLQSGLEILMPLLVTWVCSELLIILLTMLHSDAQLGAYAQLQVFPNMVYKIGDGF